MSAPSEPASKGRDGRVSGPPAWVAAVDRHGFCAWPLLGDQWGGTRGVWRSVPRPWPVDPQTDALAIRLGWQHLPQLVQEHKRSRRHGRPTLSDSDSRRAELAAYAHDICGVPVRVIAREAYPVISDDAARAQARRHLEAGRRRLHEHGVLPWIAWPAGELPADWWASDRLAAAIQQWHIEADAGALGALLLVPQSTD